MRACNTESITQGIKGKWQIAAKKKTPEEKVLRTPSSAAEPQLKLIFT